MSKLQPESRVILEHAIKLLDNPLAEEMILMAYHLGKVDGRMEQLDRSEAMVREELGLNAYVDAMLQKERQASVPGRPDHDMNTRGGPLKAGS